MTPGNRLTGHDATPSARVLINGGLPRSGTVLVGTILKALCRASDLTVRHINPPERRNMPHLATEIEKHSTGVLLVHTHLTSPEVNAALATHPGAVVFWNRRDPRDALVSFMQLHEISLDDALHAMTVYLGATSAINAVEGTTHVRYEDIAGRGEALVKALAARAGLPCSPACAARIAASTTPAAHARVMEDVGAGAGRAVLTLRRVMREDPETLITDRHIQSGRAGRWRTELNPDAQRRVEAALRPWLDCLGYA